MFVMFPAGAQTISFRISERTLQVGDSAVLRWKVDGIRKKDSIHLTGFEGIPPLKGEMVIAPEQDITYIFTHIRRKRIIQKKIKVKVYHPEILHFSGPEIAQYQVPVQLAWKTRHATQVSISEIGTMLPLNGQQMVSPLSPVTYTLEACNRNQRCVRATHRINIQGDYFRGTSAIAKGGSGELIWRFPDATEVRIEGFDSLLHEDGRMVISPAQSREYVIVAKRPTHSGYDTTIRMTVRVLVVPNKYITGVKPHTSLGKDFKMQFEIFQVDWKNYPDEILFKVMITDTLGHYITGLAPPFMSEEKSRAYFLSIIETIEGKSYPVQDFAVKEIRMMNSTPRDIALVLDYSGSMSGWFKELDNATLGFIKKKHNADRLSVLRFDDNIGVEAPLLRESQSLLSRIRFNKGEKYGGSTALYAASGAGMEQLSDSARDRVLMVMTDGYENSSMYYWGKHFTQASEVLLHARRQHITINTINFRGQANTPLLDALADMTGGKSYLLRDEKEIEKVFNELQHLYHNYYELRYKPMGSDGDRTINLLYQGTPEQQMVTTAKAWISDSINLEAIELVGLGIDTSLMKSGQPVPILRQTVALFEFDKWEIDSAASVKLDRVIAYMESHKDYKLVIQGHSDLVGETSYCTYISRARAKAVYDYLHKRGVSAKRMKYEGKGKSDPEWQIEDQPWKARENRRVELLFFH